MKTHLSLTKTALIVLAADAFAGGATKPTLKEAFKNDFLIGAALNETHFSEQNTQAVALIKTQFDSISPENALKWDSIHPKTEEYNFAAADRFVAFGEKNGMFVVGHALVWHHQTPGWVFEGDNGKPADREILLKRMRDHIHTVVGRYKGRVGGWDVVNEALNDDGTMRQSPWFSIIGEDYVAKAFEFAHEADPQAQLYYNDYLLENRAKRLGAIALIKKLESQGLPIAGVGLQGHYKLNWPTTMQLDQTIEDFAQAGVKVNITELDMDVLPPASGYQGADIAVNFELRDKLNPYTNALPESVQEALAKRYTDLFTVFLKHRDAVSRVTFWGVTDASSWLNNWPVKGRTAYPLLFDRNYQPKPAFRAVIEAASKAGK